MVKKTCPVHTTLSAVKKKYSLADIGAIGLEAVSVSEIIQLAAWPDTRDKLVNIIESETNLSLSPIVESGKSLAATNGAYSCFNITDEKMLLVCHHAILPSTLENIDSDIGAATLLGHARAMLRVSGDKHMLKDLWQLCFAIDMDEDVFVESMYAQTAFHHSSVLIHRRADMVANGGVMTSGEYDIYFTSSFAESLISVFCEIALQFNLAIRLNS